MYTIQLRDGTIVTSNDITLLEDMSQRELTNSINII